VQFYTGLEHLILVDGRCMKSLSSNTDRSLVDCVVSWGYELHGNGSTQEEACLRPTEVQHVWVRYKLQQNGITKLPHYDAVRTRCVEKFDTPPYGRLSDLGLFNETVSAVAWRRKRRQYHREWGVDKVSKQGGRYENRAHKGPWLLKEIVRNSVGANQAGTLRLQVCCFD
jgi:hypothetical protein